jgi:alpha-1,3-rhamnosyl/mannosyltransferase
MRIAFDVSCAAESPLTGMAYAAIRQLDALRALSPDLDVCLFATGDRTGPDTLKRALPDYTDQRVYRRARLLKHYFWTSLLWPPVERFTGPVDIAHGLCHQTPATRKALRVVTVHDLSCYRVPETHTARMVKVQRRLLEQSARVADHIVTVSENAREELITLLNVAPYRVTAVPNGVCLEEFETPLDKSQLAATKQELGVERPYFIHLGTIEPRKNIGTLLEAYSQLRDSISDIPQLVLVGKEGWKSKDVMKSLPEFGDDVVHAGYLNRVDAIALLRDAAACVYPSIYEGFGLPILEAMAARTPVVASNRSAIPEVAGDCAVLVDPDSPEAIAQAMGQVLDDTDATQARVEAAQARARTFTWERSAQELMALYDRLTEG